MEGPTCFFVYQIFITTDISSSFLGSVTSTNVKKCIDNYILCLELWEYFIVIISFSLSTPLSYYNDIVPPFNRSFVLNELSSLREVYTTFICNYLANDTGPWLRLCQGRINMPFWNVLIYIKQITENYEWILTIPTLTSNFVDFSIYCFGLT